VIVSTGAIIGMLAGKNNANYLPPGGQFFVNGDSFILNGYIPTGT
jgi:hypothetical protein